MRPICVKCQREMECVKNEFPVYEKGVLSRGGYPPVTVWCGDLFECPDCRTQIVTGFGEALSGDAVQAYEAKAMEFERS